MKKTFFAFFPFWKSSYGNNAIKINTHCFIYREKMLTPKIFFLIGFVVGLCACAVVWISIYFGTKTPVLSLSDSGISLVLVDPTASKENYKLFMDCLTSSKQAVQDVPMKNITESQIKRQMPWIKTFEWAVTNRMNLDQLMWKFKSFQSYGDVPAAVEVGIVRQINFLIIQSKVSKKDLGKIENLLLFPPSYDHKEFFEKISKFNSESIEKINTSIIDIMKLNFN